MYASVRHCHVIELWWHNFSDSFIDTNYGDTSNYGDSLLNALIKDSYPSVRLARFVAPSGSQ